jgi:hypothetical protein
LIFKPSRGKSRSFKTWTKGSESFLVPVALADTIPRLTLGIPLRFVPLFGCGKFF